MSKVRKERVTVQREVLRSIHDYKWDDIVALVRNDIILNMRNMPDKPRKEDIEVKLSQNPLNAATSGNMVISAAFDVDDFPEAKDNKDSPL